MKSAQRLESEVHALMIALQITATALRLNATCPEYGEDAWPEVATDDQVLRRVWGALFPLMGFNVGIEHAVEMLSPHNPTPEMCDQADLLRRWENLRLSASLTSSGAFAVRPVAG